MAQRPACAAIARTCWKRPRTIDRWCGYVLARQFTDPDGWELQNMLTVARLMIEAALSAGGNPRRPPAHRLSRHATTSIGSGASRFVASLSARQFEEQSAASPLVDPRSWLDIRAPNILGFTAMDLGIFSARWRSIAAPLLRKSGQGRYVRRTF